MAVRMPQEKTLQTGRGDHVGMLCGLLCVFAFEIIVYIYSHVLPSSAREAADKIGQLVYFSDAG